MIDFVFPEQKLFPINKPEDIKIAIENYHIFSDDVDYDVFVYRLANLASKKGQLFVSELPIKIKKLIGLRKENRPEQNKEVLHKRVKKPDRFIRKIRDEDFD